MIAASSPRRSCCAASCVSWRVTASRTALGKAAVVGDEDRLRRRHRARPAPADRRRSSADRCCDRRPPASPTGRRSCRCRPCRRRGAWRPRHRHCPGRRSCRPARWSPCRKPAPRSPARRRRDRSRRRPAICAAASTSGLSTPSGDGTAIATRATPATLRRHRVHQHRRGISRRAAGHIEADRADRAISAQPSRTPLRIGVVEIGGQLRPVIGLDPRSAAKRSASSAAGLHCFAAASISAAGTRIVAGVRSSRSRRLVCSITAASPRAAHVGRGSPPPRRRHRPRSRAWRRGTRRKPPRNPGAPLSSLSGIGRLAEALDPAVDLLGAGLERGAVDDEARGDVGDVLDLDQAVGLQGAAGLHQIDDLPRAGPCSAPAPSRR